MKFVAKAIVYYAVCVIAALAICAGINVVLYSWMNWVGLLELGKSIGFVVGLALLETGLFGCAVSMLSEEVLFDDEDEDNDDCEDIFGEP